MAPTPPPPPPDQECLTSLWIFIKPGTEHHAGRGYPMFIYRNLLMGPTVVGSGPAKDDGFLWVIKICNAHFLQRGSEAADPMS
jgi:hypothetical protein